MDNSHMMNQRRSKRVLRPNDRFSYGTDSPEPGNSNNISKSGRYPMITIESGPLVPHRSNYDSVVTKRRHSEYPRPPIPQQQQQAQSSFARSGELTNPTNSNSSVTNSSPKFGPSKKQPHRKDLNNYPAHQSFPLDIGKGTQIQTLGNEITDETVVATLSTDSLTIYCLKSTTIERKVEENENNDIDQGETIFELKKIHELASDSFNLISFALSTCCSVSLLPKRLTYAVGTTNSNIVYLYKVVDAGVISPAIHLSSDIAMGRRSSFISLVNCSKTLKMAMKDDKYLACILENRTVVVWDIRDPDKEATFSLKSNGVHVAWHANEPKKLMVAEENGWIKFYNISKQKCVMSFFSGKTPLYSADWSTTNSLMVVVGWSGGISIINTSQANSNLFKTHENQSKNVSIVKFSTTDDKCIASFGRSPGTLRFWRTNYASHSWSTTNNQILDVAWVHQKPYIVALCHQHIKVFDAL